MSRKTKTFPFLWKTLPQNKINQKILMKNLANSYWYFYDLLYFSWQIWNATERFSQFTLSGPKICWKSRNFFLFFPKCTESGTYFNFFCKFSLQSFPVCYEKLGNHFLGVKCPKNPSLKCQIFKTFPFPGERNKDKYLPLQSALVLLLTKKGFSTS